ncbi:MAG TPA: hypothetical protein VKA67_09805 [Verrucomicrobiae bacterium]|nr:hypothetical protein [Verrucomicrobiae bacterium]
MKKGKKQSGCTISKKIKVLKVPVVFPELTEPRPQSISIVGQFKDWQPETTRRYHTGDGFLIKQLSLPPGDYECHLAVGGQQIRDPSTRAYAHSPIGGINSALVIPARPPEDSPDQ